MKRDVKMDIPKLRNLAEVCNHRDVWAFLSDLQSLAFHLGSTIWQTISINNRNNIIAKNVVGNRN